MRARLLLLTALSAACAFGAYTWDYTTLTSSYHGVLVYSGWTQNGSVGAMFTDFSGAGGSLIRTSTISGTNPNDYEINTPITTANGGGTFIHFVRASSNAQAFPTSCAGSYISAEIAVIGTTHSSPVVPAQLNINQCSSGTLTHLASTNLSIEDGTGFRTVVWGTTLWVFLANQQVLAQPIPSTTGQPGIGGYAISLGNFIDGSIGHHDVVAPSTLAVPALHSSILPTSISMSFDGVADDANGIGVYGFCVVRGSSSTPCSGTTGSASSIVPLGGAFSDSSLTASTSYIYSIAALDFHGNAATATSLTVTTPPSTAVDPRRIGVGGTGSYWGGGGEQIDTLSGNLNFSLPLLQPMGRTGWSVPVNLNYNSQNWKQDSGINWNLGTDVGDGYGWRIEIGSVTPYFNPGWTSGVHHYVFTDGTGREYRLDQQSGTIWSSQQGIYVWFDSSTNILHFKDGSFWHLGSVSGGAEQDAGTMYPTVIQDVNGNQILVTYHAAPTLPGTTNNTSGRIARIWDVRAPVPDPTYVFTYDNDCTYIGCPAPLNAAIPHLKSIANNIGTPETYFFGYGTALVPLGPPFGSDTAYSAATTAHLTGVSVPTGGTGAYVMSYDTPHSGATSSGANELTKVDFPSGGHLAWDYASVTYAGSRLFREVSTRYLAADSGGATEWSYPFTHSDTGTTIASVHADTTLADPSGVGSKTWTFATSGSAWQMGLLAQFAQKTTPSSTVALTADTYTWAQSSSGNPYIAAKVSVADGITAQSAQITQSIDDYGNTTQVQIYPYGSTTTALRTYSNTYLSASTYVAAYIRNRLLHTTLAVGTGTPKTLVENYYDGTPQTTVQPTPAYACTFSWYSGAPTSPETDPHPPLAGNSRGTLYETVTAAKSTCLAHDAFGNVSTVTGSDGTTTTASASSLSNYAAPATITTDSYNESVSYNSWLGVTQTTGANGEQMLMTYDSIGRPQYAYSPYWTSGGPTESYSYPPAYYAIPMTQTKNGADGYTKTTLDGVGRPVRIDRGATSPTSATKMEYGPCACSPLGKLTRTSEPFASGGSPSAWTTYTYDGIGRPLSVQAPDGASTATYSYSGNETTATDAAGKSKKLTTDELGNLIQVAEPDPAGGWLYTNYTYDWMNHLACTDMTRGGSWTSTLSTYTVNGVTCTTGYTGGTRQTRTFVYNDAGQLTSATNPESGTVTYAYNSDTTLDKKTDAKGQVEVFGYDLTKRLTGTKWYPGGYPGTEDICQRVTYAYGTDSTSYNFGRLLTTSYGTLSGPYYDADGLYGTCISGAQATSYQETYAYHPAGKVTSKQLAVTRRMWNSGGFVATGTATLAAVYTYDNVGRPSTTAYKLRDVPYWVPTSHVFTTTYDGMGRPAGLTSNDYYGTTVNWAHDVTYDIAGRMTGMDRYLSSSATCETSSTYTPIPVDNEITETRGYNVMGQMTSKQFSSTEVGCAFIPWVNVWAGTSTSWSGNLAYGFSSTQNNGQITYMDDRMASPAGETVSYQYDSLKHLTSAAATPNSGSGLAAWTQTFQYDGFGNLTAKILGGTTTTIGVTAGTNRLSSSSYDANGNMLTGVGATFTYDEANRMTSATPISAGTDYYGYAPDNKRIYRKPATSWWEEFTFYGAFGEKLGTYHWYDPDCISTTCTLSAGSTNVYFAGSPIWNSVNAGTVTDRVGTNRQLNARFRPYGEEITSTANDRAKFATYTRDGFTTLDYADQRYYANNYGRFNTVDRGPSNLGMPQSLNRYAYAGSDPVNSNDPSGLCTVDMHGNFWDNDDEYHDDNSTLWNGVGGPCTASTDWLQMVAGRGGVWLNDEWFVNTELPEPEPCFQAMNSAACGGGSDPAPAEPGGGGGGGGPVGPAAGNQYQAAAALAQQLANLTPHCEEVLPVGQLTQKAGNLSFWDARINGTISLAMIGAANVQLSNGKFATNIGTAMTRYPSAAALTLVAVGGGLSNNVVLGSYFFNNETAAQQGITLLHELLHVTTQLGDVDFDRQYHITGAPGQSASAALTSWLTNDCQNK